ncbi:GGDEF domain-containing protein [Vibrio sp. 404]|uniref:diguanylate cyclase n=1 Tax=Vibrio marinisediminis TaxID=2758441 RepID=A0A7W2FNH3_9VIBR|nr:GGDEF domain-containing protein [Vibrio marinisediminis]MBA5761351.1 GGDEF domain-containing protein [Vibrio marinisediminis]
MNFIKKAISIFSAVFLILLTLYVLSDEYGVESTRNENALPTSLERYLPILLQHRATEAIQELPTYLSEPDLQAWLASSHRETRLLSHWILANEALRQSEFERAEEHALSAVSLLNDETSIELRAKLYFNLSLAQIKQNKVEASTNSFEQVASLFEKYNGSHNEIFITYFMKRAFELSHQESSSDELVIFWEDIYQKASAIEYQRIDDIYYYLGTAYWNARQFVKGTNLKVKAIEVSLERNDDDQIQFMMTDVGIDYLFNGNYHQAIKQFNKVIEYNQKSDKENPERLHYILIKLYAAYTEAGDIFKAGEVLIEAETQLKKIETPSVQQHYQTYLYAMQADYARRIGDAGEALRLIKLAKERHEGEYHARVYQFDVTLDMIFGDVYYLRQDFDEAVKYHQSAESKIIIRDLYYLEASIHRKLYQDYLAQKKLALALRHLEEESKLQRQQKLDINEQYSQYIYSQFESKKQQGRIAELEYSTERSKWMFTFLAVVLLTLILFVWMLKSKNRKITQLNALLTTLSTTDGLTSISNRRAFDEYLRVWNSPPISIQMRAIFMLDIDSFKRYNDFYGHAAGDHVIKAVAKAIKEQCRQHDFVARYGGEEFVVLMSDTTPEMALALASQIQTSIDALNMPHAKSAISHKVTLSIGVLTCPKGVDSDAHELMKLTDSALYQAKSQGRNQICHIPYDV